MPSPPLMSPPLVPSALMSPPTISEWEKTTYYNGISLDPPELLYRSDFLENPFPLPVGRFPHLPTKTVYGVFGTPLNAVWDTVAPQIRNLLKDRKIRYSAIKAARFVTHGKDGKDTLGPVVIWIATYPETTTTENAYDASPGILTLLETNGVKGAVVEWYEGAAEKLSGPSLLCVVTGDANPTHYVRRLFTSALSMSIATEEMEADDAQGSVAMFFHENKDRCGNASAKVFGVSNCHVLRQETTVKYEFRGAGAPPQCVRLAGFHRFQRALNEIKDCISGRRTIADRLARRIVWLETKPKTEDPDEAADDEEDVEDMRRSLAKAKKDIGVLEAFYKEIHSQWGDIARRNIGHVDWAPEISVDIEGHRYTRDIGTFEVEAAKFKAQFKGNVVDLGSKFTPLQLTNVFYPQSGGSMAVELLAVPNCFDCNGEPCSIVMKDGGTTDLTVGRLTGLEAYLCDESGVESKELAIYNYDRQSGPFSDHGDSGSLIFNGEGQMVGILHSGMPKGRSKHVTFTTPPAWWAIEQLKRKYPDADFNCVTF